MNLNADYTFKNFITNDDNPIIVDLLIEATNNLGKNNPICIYGDVSSGKTHLLNALGNYVSLKNPEFNVLYTDVSEFTEDLINCIRHDKMRQFREKYDSKHVLIIDNFEDIEGKSHTQMEIKKIIDYFYQEKKQFIFASSEKLKKLKISKSLLYRLEGGIIYELTKINTKGFLDSFLERETIKLNTQLKIIKLLQDKKNDLDLSNIDLRKVKSLISTITSTSFVNSSDNEQVIKKLLEQY